MEERRLSEDPQARPTPKWRRGRGPTDWGEEAKSAAEGGELRAQKRGSPHEARKVGG